jgi:hypothetical protein
MLMKYSPSFKILSTRNKASIQRTLEFFEASGIEVFGQEDIRVHGSKLGVAKQKQWLKNGDFVVYIDDMHSHLAPFEEEADLCLHAGWGYDPAQVNSYTQDQALERIFGLLQLAFKGAG